MSFEPILCKQMFRCKSVRYIFKPPNTTAIGTPKNRGIQKMRGLGVLYIITYNKSIWGLKMYWGVNYMYIVRYD